MLNKQYSKYLEDPSPANRAAVLQALMPTINSELQRFSGPKTVLRGRAKVLALKALDTYNPASGAQLRSWVVTQLQPLSRYDKQIRPVRAPELVVRQGAELNRIRQEALDRTGKEPTAAELADMTGLSVRRVNDLTARAMATVSEGTLDPIDDTRAESPPAYTASPLDFSTEAVYDSLDKRDRMIFDLKTGRTGTPMANQDIAKRMGLSPAAISQRSQRIAEQINRVAQIQ